MSQNELEIAPAAGLAERFAGRVAAASRAAVAIRGRFALAISGGSAADTFLPALASVDLPWGAVELFWVDERAVPPDDPESNFGLARRAGLDRLPLRREAIHRLRGEAADLDAAAADGERELRAVVGGGRVDVALVGVGPDGHVASLFPGHPALAESRRWLVAVNGAPKPPARRLTWTLPAFERVDLLVVAAFGEAKAEAVAAAREPSGSPLPVARAAALAARRLLLVDPAAGGLVAR